MDTKPVIDINALVSARENIHLGLKQSALLGSSNAEVRDSILRVASYAEEPEAWEMVISLVDMAERRKTDLANVVNQLELENVKTSMNSSMDAFLDTYEKIPSLDRERLIKGAVILAANPVEKWNMDKVVVTTLDVCSRICRKNKACIKRCMDGRLMEKLGHGQK